VCRITTCQTKHREGVMSSNGAIANTLNCCNVYCIWVLTTRIIFCNVLSGWGSVRCLFPMSASNLTFERILKAAIFMNPLVSNPALLVIAAWQQHG